MNTIPARMLAAVVATTTITVLPFTPIADAASDRSVQFYLTGYSWWDNTPAGSSTISDPVIHRTAGGVGTYADPITLAVGHSITAAGDVLDYPAGTRMYIPNLRRYVIVEDTCGDGSTPQNGPCHTGYRTSSGRVPWIDVYVGGEGTSRRLSDACMDAITGVTRVILNPAKDYLVAAGPISDGRCVQYGVTPVRVPAATPTTTMTTADSPTTAPPTLSPRPAAATPTPLAPAPSAPPTSTPPTLTPTAPTPSPTTKPTASTTAVTTTAPTTVPAATAPATPSSTPAPAVVTPVTSAPAPGAPTVRAVPQPTDTPAVEAPRSSHRRAPWDGWFGRTKGWWRGFMHWMGTDN